MNWCKIVKTASLEENTSFTYKEHLQRSECGVSGEYCDLRGEILPGTPKLALHAQLSETGWIRVSTGACLATSIRTERAQRLRS